jgi:hypothetical protein
MDIQSIGTPLQIRFRVSHDYRKEGGIPCGAWDKSGCIIMRSKVGCQGDGLQACATFRNFPQVFCDPNDLYS